MCECLVQYTEYGEVWSVCEACTGTLRDLGAEAPDGLDLALSGALGEAAKQEGLAASYQFDSDRLSRKCAQLGEVIDRVKDWEKWQRGKDDTNYNGKGVFVWWSELNFLRDLWLTDPKPGGMNNG